MKFQSHLRCGFIHPKIKNDKETHHMTGRIGSDQTRPTHHLAQHHIIINNARINHKIENVKFTFSI